MGRARLLRGMAGRVQGKVAKVAAKGLPKAKNAGKGKVPNIPKRRPPSKPKASNPKLQNVINDIWKWAHNPSTVGDRTTMDAIRNELLTGRPSNRVWHQKKGLQYMNSLRKLLAKKWGRDVLSSEDRRIAQDLYNALRDAYRRGGGHPPQ